MVVFFRLYCRIQCSGGIAGLVFKVALEVFAPPAPPFVVGPVCVF